MNRNQENNEEKPKGAASHGRFQFFYNRATQRRTHLVALFRRTTTVVRAQAILTQIRVQCRPLMCKYECYRCTTCTHGAVAPRSWQINLERGSATVRAPEPNLSLPRSKELSHVSLARWLGGVRFDHHYPSLLQQAAGLWQATPRGIIFQGAEVL